MITLNTTLETLNLETRTTASCDYLVCYADHTTTTFTANTSQGNIASITNTAILIAPAAATQREILFISVRNKAAGNTTVIFKKNTSTTEYHITSPVSLRSGEAIIYTPQTGFVPHHANGIPYWIESVGFPVPSQQLTGLFSTNGWASTKSIANNTIDAYYIGRAPFSVDAVKVRFNVATAATGTMSWAECAIAKGAPVFNGDATLVPLGYANIASQVAGAGMYTIVVPITQPNYVTEYDDLWVLFGASYGTALPTYRAPSIGDNVQAGFFQTRASAAQTSTTLGSSLAFTLQTGTNTCIATSIGWT